MFPVVCFSKILGLLFRSELELAKLWDVPHLQPGFVTRTFAFQASDYLSPEDLLKSEVEESQRKLQVVVDTLNFFKQVFQDRREDLHTYFKESQEVRAWDFQSSLVFVRLDGFLRRLLVVQVSVLTHPRSWLHAGGSSQGPRKRIGK